jgi:hypothetical protein
MANINAILSTFPTRRILNATSYNWVVQFNCMPVTGGQFTAEDFDIELKVPVAIGDSAATIKTKILDALSAAITARGQGDTVTVVNSLDFVRWL